MAGRGVLAVLVLLLVCALALTLLLLGGAPAGRAGRVGGKEQAPPAKSLVVDTLNIAHWARRRGPPHAKVGICEALDVIGVTAPLLRERFPDRLIYVVKERESARPKEQCERERALYQAAARREHVRIDVVERLPDPPPRGRPEARDPHAARGRDDFYTLMTAWKLGCGVLSRDRFRDLEEMKAGDLPPFHVFRYTPWGVAPGRDFVKPSADEFRRMRRPRLYSPEELLPSL